MSELLPTAAEVARIRDLLPTTLGTAELREALAAELRVRSVFSARVANVTFLDAIKFAVDELAAGKTDHATARWYLGEMLKELGYTPEGGFPDAPAGEVPPAIEGSLQDVSSRRRLDLILDTQLALVRGRGQQLRGLDPDRLAQFPAYELVRAAARMEPRDWLSRWAIAGGVLIAGGRMIALKGDPVFGELGSSANFDDALDVNFSPFAFNSGMVLVEVSRGECLTLGVRGPNGESIDEWFAKPHPLLVGTQSGIPAPQASVRQIDPAIRRAFEQSADVDIVEDTATTKGNADAIRSRIAERRAAREARRRARGEAWERRAAQAYEGGEP